MFVDALPGPVRNLLTRLGREESTRTFYLAGVSAVALHLGHRISVDLDFFTKSPAFDADGLLHDLVSIGPIDIEQQDRRTLLGRLGGVKFSFVYTYPLLEETETVAGVRVAKLLDLALMKVVAISQRGTRRDFVDLYCLCRKRLRLADVLQRIPEKFRDISYPSYHLLRSLVYFDDAESDEPPKMRTDLDWERVKSFFRGEVEPLFGSL